MNTPTKPPYKGKYSGGPRFRRYTREELVANSSVGYYAVKAYLANLEAWRLHDIEKRLASLLEWGAWRFNSEQKAEITRRPREGQARDSASSLTERQGGEQSPFVSPSKEGLREPPPSKLGHRAKRKKAIPSATGRPFQTFTKNVPSGLAFPRTPIYTPYSNQPRLNQMSIANRAFVGALAFVHAAFHGMEAMKTKMAVNQNLLKFGGAAENFHHFASNGTENHRGGPGNRKSQTRSRGRPRERLRNRLAHRG
jgi:hypothetical protein